MIIKKLKVNIKYPNKKILNFFAGLVIVLMIFSFFSPIVFAAFNKQINYQGKLTDASNVAVPNGTYNMEFKLYTVSTGGTAIWTETRTSPNQVTVTNGLFSVMLGSVSSLAGVDFNQTLYLGVNIGGTGATPVWDGEMAPRKILGAVPAAFTAETVTGASQPNITSLGTLTGLTVSGNVRGSADDTYFGMDTTNPRLGYTKKSGYAPMLTHGSSTYFVIARSSGTDIGATNTFTNEFVVDTSGRVGIGTSLPSAVLNLKAGTSTANTAPLKFTSGANLTTPEAGAMEYSSNTLYFTPSTTRYPVTLSTGTSSQFIKGDGSLDSNTYLTTGTASSTYVPYTGGTSNVDLGLHNLTVDTNSLFVDSVNHRVGIGTTTPGNVLEVVGASGTQINMHSTSGLASDNTFLQFGGGRGNIGYDGVFGGTRIATSDPSKPIVFANSLTAGTGEVMRIVTGNLGLGTTTPTSNLQVTQPTTGVGTVSNLAGGTTVTGTGTQFTNTFKVGDTITIGGQTVAISAIASDTSMTTAAITNANTNVAYTLTGGDRFVVKGNGNVGVGTVSPNSLLDIYKVGSGSSSKGVTIRDNVTPAYGANADNLLTVRGTGASTTTWRGRITAGGDNVEFLMGEYASKAWLGAHNAALNAWADLYISPDGNSQKTYIGSIGGVLGGPALTVQNSDGYVGIGTTNPTANLHINGGGTTTGAKLHVTDGVKTSADLNTMFILGSNETSGAFELVTGRSAAGTSGYWQMQSVEQGVGYRSLVFNPNGGNVGIGTTNPGAKLDINGPAVGSGMNLRTQGDVLVGATTGASIFFDGNYSYASGNYIRAIAANTQTFATSGSERMRITSTGNIGIGTTAPGSKLEVDGSTAANGATTAIAGILGGYTFNPTAGGVQVGNRFVVTNSPTTTANTGVGEILRMVDNTTLSNLIRGLDITSNGGSNTAGTNTGLRAAGATFGIQGITNAVAGGVSVPAAIYGESTGTTQGDVLRLYSNTVTSANSFATFYHDTSAFSGTGLLMDFATGSGTFTGNFIDLQNNNASMFKVTSNGIVSMGLSSTAATSAVCSSLANGTAPTAGVAYEIRDCSSTPVADYAEMYPVESDVTYGDIVATGGETVHTYDMSPDGSIDWTKIKGDITKLTKSSKEYQSSTIGIVSDNHNDFSSTGYNIKKEDNPMPVALSGRVPVKIAPKSDSIKAGDYLTTSSDPGMAMKATKSGFVIGKALEDWDPASGKPTVMVYVEQGYYKNINDVAYEFNDQVTFNGLTFFNGDVNFAKSITFSNSVEFTVPPLFNSDTAGFAVIKSGSREVRVTFDNPYVSTPVVSANITFDKEGSDSPTNVSVINTDTFFSQGISFIVKDKDKTGFTIIINKNAQEDINFSWIALAVKNPKVFESLVSGLVIDTGSTNTTSVASTSPDSSLDTVTAATTTTTVDSTSQTASVFDSTASTSDSTTALDSSTTSTSTSTNTTDNTNPTTGTTTATNLTTTDASTTNTTTSTTVTDSSATIPAPSSDATTTTATTTSTTTVDATANTTSSVADTSTTSSGATTSNVSSSSGSTVSSGGSSSSSTDPTVTN